MGTTSIFASMTNVIFLHILLSCQNIILVHGEYLLVNTYPKSEEKEKIFLVGTEEKLEDILLHQKKDKSRTNDDEDDYKYDFKDQLWEEDVEPIKRIVRKFHKTMLK